MKNKKGFTLVELLVVIAIIAIIAAVAVPVTISQIDKAKIATAENEAENAISAVQNAAVIIGSDSATYPDGITSANLLKELNKSFTGLKQIKSVVVSKSVDGKTHITITGKDDVKKNNQNIVKETDLSIDVVEECKYIVENGALKKA